MRIEQVETILTHPVSWTGEFRDPWFIVRIHTDNGISGIGEGTYTKSPEAVQMLVNSFREHLIGQDPLRIEQHWQRLHWGGHFRGPALYSALGAVDVALWDIAGKYYEAPIYQLMGGKLRDKVRLYDMVPKGTVDEIVRISKDLVAEGFTAVKINPVPPDFISMTYAQRMRETVERVSAVREAVGPDVDVAVEIGRALDTGEGISLGMELEKFRLLFYEDAIPPESIQSYSEVAAKVRIPIATGERLFNMWEFRELLEARGAHIVRPDIGTSGGLTHCRKIAAVAESFGAKFMAHNYLSPITTAACVQLDACIPNFAIQEYCRDHKPPKSELLKIPLQPVDGYLIVPDAPGLGVELNDEFISKHPYTHRPSELSPAVGKDGSIDMA